MANEEKRRKPAKGWQTGSQRGLHGRAVIVQPIATDWDWLGKVIGPVDATFEREAERQPEEQARPGWAEAAQALAGKGGDALVMGEFGNEATESSK